MRKLTVREQKELQKEYKEKRKQNIKVTDFESAVERCKQKFVQNIHAEKRKYRSDRWFKQRYNSMYHNAADRKLEYDYRYIGKILRGEIKPPCANSVVRFHAIMRSKYGSVRHWHSLKALNSVGGNEDDSIR